MDAEPIGTGAHTGFRETIVLPGDDVTDALVAVTADIRVGHGLLQRGERISAVTAGVLSWRHPNRFFVLSNHKRYVPAVGDTVVGVVTDRMAESYSVRLHGTAMAQLPHLAFDGATQRHKPELRPGALVFARVASKSPFLDPELSCTVLSGPRKEWATGQAVFGELKGGTLVHVSTGLARRLLDPACALLSTLGAAVPFEAAVGLNGLVWIQAGSSAHTAAVCAAIAQAEALNEEQCEALARAVAAQVAGVKS
jgi:exosome complex component RRP40